MSDDKTSKDRDVWAELQRPFDSAQVGKLPRITCGKCRDQRSKVCDEHRKQKCSDCDNWITTAHLHLDYVGHAQVTARLLEVDPEWYWEPVAWDTDGMPAIAVEQNGRRVMWIKLTVAGMTRLGVGISGAGEEVEKVLIGDALRNAAMRFGVALDLWAKGDLHGQDDTVAPSDRVPDPEPPTTADTPVDWAALGWKDKDDHDAALEQARAVARRLPDPHRGNVKDWVKDEAGAPPYSSAFIDEWCDMMDGLTADPLPEVDEPLPSVQETLG